MRLDAIQRAHLLGVYVDVLDIPLLNQILEYAIRNREKWIIANHNLHSVYLYHRHPVMSAFCERARFIHVDGMPIVFAAKLLGLPLSRRNRIGYIDWLPPLMREAAKNSWRIYYLGSKPGVAEKGANVLRREFPGLIMRTHHGYFDASPHGADNPRIVAEINEFDPDILMVGMGMPRQEAWILENIAGVNARVFLNAGACIDYFAGEVPLTPRWLGQIGLEWLYRLFLNPKYFWKRYLIEPWFLVKYFVRDIFKSRRS